MSNPHIASFLADWPDEDPALVRQRIAVLAAKKVAAAEDYLVERQVGFGAVLYVARCCSKVFENLTWEDTTARAALAGIEQAVFGYVLGVELGARPKRMRAKRRAVLKLMEKAKRDK